MAKQPPHDDNKSKKTDAAGKRPDEFKSPKTPRPEDTKSPRTPKPPTIPNMSLDEPEEIFEAAEVIEDEALPVEEAGPTSDEAASVLADEDVVAAEDVEKMPTPTPMSDVFLGEDMPMEAAPFSAKPASEVLEAAEVVEEAEPIEEAAEVVADEDVLSAAEPSSVHKQKHPTPQPSSEPDLNALFGEPEAAEEVVEEAEELTGSSAVLAEAEPVTEPSAILSGVAPAAEAPAAAPDEIVHASDVVSAHEAPAMSPHSDVVASHEPIEQGAPMPPSDIVAAHEPVEHVAEEAVEPASAVEAEEFAEAVPDSDVLAAEEAEEAEEVMEAASAVEDDDVFAAEEAEAEPVSAIESGEMAQEVAEAVEDTSSATRKAEEVLDEEAVEAGPISASSGSGVVFDDLPAEAGSGKKPRSGSAKTADFDQTVAFEGAPSSSAKKSDDDVLITEEEVVGGSEASAVNLGELPKKGSSVSGIDKVAEALESGTDIGGDEAKAAPSVEFDELLDDLGDSDEHKAAAAAEAVDADGSTEMDASVIEEEFDTAKGAAGKNGKKDKKEGKGKKQGKSGVKATGDDIDLDELFGEKSAEAEEAVEAADAEEAEAVEAADAESAAAEIFDDDSEAAAAVFDEETEAAEATDDDELADFGEEEETKAKDKKGKKAHQQDEDEEEGAKNKKGKKDKTKAAAPEKQRGMVLPLLGGMVVAGLVLVGGFAAALFVAPDQIRGVVDMVAQPEPKKNIIPPDNTGKKKDKIDEARTALAKGDYKAVFAGLEGSKEPDDLAVLGEARWMEYFKQQEDKKAPLEKDAPPVVQALKELQSSSNKLLARQIETQIAASSKESDLKDQLNTTMMEKEKVQKQLTDALTAKTGADKVVDSIATVLFNSKLIADKSKFDPSSLDKIVKGLSTDKAALDKLNAMLDGTFKKTGEAGLMEILTLKDQADKSLAAVNKALESANVKDKDAKGIEELAKARDSLQTEIKSLDALLAQAVKEFSDGNILPPNADPRKQLVEGAKTARLKAESPLSIPLAQLGMSLGGIGSTTSKLVEDALGMAKTATELKWYQARENFIESPQQRMNTLVGLLQDRSQTDPAHLKAISREADWVINPDSKSDAEARAKAHFVKGLALRNQEKYAEAKTEFEQTLKLVPANAAWKGKVAQSLKELTDPHSYYLPKIEQADATGNPQAAVKAADAAIKAMPNEGRLFARRALANLELQRGKAIPEQVQTAVRADAAAATKDEKAAAEAAYVLGRLEEALGKLDVAEKQYRMAIKLHDDQKAPSEDAGKYRVALGRLLLRERLQGAPAPAAPPNAEEKKTDAESKNEDAKNEGATIVVHPWSLLLASAVIQQVPSDDIEDKETLARLKEVIDEAEKLKASKSAKLQGQGYCLMGSALSKLGKRTEGLREYAKGLQLLYPGIETTEMKELIDSHPAFQQPDASDAPNPIMAERHFGEGVHLFWKGMSNPRAATAQQDFKDAEHQFAQAIRFYGKDARYQYFLGFAMFQQKTRAKRDSAIFAFEKGAQLEATSVQANPFATREINQSLERIQGDMRELLNFYRFRPATEPETKKSEVAS